MRIGIDARFWSEQGHGRYIRNLVNELAQIDRENQYVVFLRKSDVAKFHIPNSRFQIVEADIRWYTLKEQLILPWIYYRQNLDVLHVPHFNIPVLYFKPFIVTIHDLTITHFPSIRATTLPKPVWKLKRFFYHLILRIALHRAKKIIAVSNFTKSEVHKFYPSIPHDKVVVTHEAVDPMLIEKAKVVKVTDDTVAQTKQKYGIDNQYLLYIGNVHPHKNIDRLIRVAENLYKDIGVRLVLVGKDDYFQKRLRQETEQARSVIWTGFVPDEDLIPLFKGAAAFVFPSLMEGFGIPPLEAMACGTPTIVSNAGSLPEVCGDASVYFDPSREDEMYQVIKTVLEDSTVRLTCIQNGYKQIETYSWKTMAEQTQQIYRLI